MRRARKERRTGSLSKARDIKLWLDDVRDPKAYTTVAYTWARTAQEAIKWLKTGRVTYASLDHDLGGPETGYAVVLWMEAHNVWPVDGTDVHSLNYIGATRMRQVIDRHYRPEG